MGREFLDLFQDWAESYDDSVTGKDIEYRDVFVNYEEILDSVTARSRGTVLEFGPGTGNLTKKLLGAGLKVVPVEPSPEMRAVAKQKLGKKVPLLDGDFLDFEVKERIDTIVSTYAFHHLTDEEKGKAFAIYGKLLSKGGKIIFADTVFESDQHHLDFINRAEEQGFHNLAEDLRREYYTTIGTLETLLSENGFSHSFKQVNRFVWVMEATKL